MKNNKKYFDKLKNIVYTKVFGVILAVVALIIVLLCVAVVCNFRFGEFLGLEANTWIAGLILPLSLVSIPAYSLVVSLRTFNENTKEMIRRKAAEQRDEYWTRVFNLIEIKESKNEYLYEPLKDLFHRELSQMGMSSEYYEIFWKIDVGDEESLENLRSGEENLINPEDEESDNKVNLGLEKLRKLHQELA